MLGTRVDTNIPTCLGISNVTQTQNAHTLPHQPTHTPTHIPTHIQVPTHISTIHIPANLQITHTHMYVCTHTQTHTLLYICAYCYIRVQIPARSEAAALHAQLAPCYCTRLTRMHEYINTYIHTYVYTYMQHRSTSATAVYAA